MKQKTWQKIKANQELLPQYLMREKVIDVIREFFKSKQFHEAQTPVLVPVPSIEPNLEVFKTELTTSLQKKRSAFLIMSPEYSLKKLLAAGIGNVFEITRCFRNEEEASRQHNPEFTMLEWYRTEADYLEIMDDFEALFIRIIQVTQPQADLTHWEYQGEYYDLSSPWERISVAEAFERFAHIDVETLLSKSQLLVVGKEKGYRVDETTTWEQMFYQIFFNEIEPSLKNSGKPTFIYDYPLSQASLARKKQRDPRFAERFEVYLAGLELGNCFSELVDAPEQRSRFEADLQARKTLDKTDYPIDEDLLAALESGLPQVAGIAVGVDRLIMLAANVDSVAETLFFPANELFDL